MLSAPPTLTTALKPPMNPAPSHPRFSKWKLLLPIWLAQAVLIYLFVPAWFLSAVKVQAGTNMGLFTLRDYLDGLRDPAWFFWWLVIITVLTFLQTVFLWPIRRPAARQTRGWPIFLSLAVAALAITALSAGLVLALVNSFDLFVLQPKKTSLNHIVPSEWWGAALIVWCILNWLIATPLLIRFCKRGPRESLLSRVASRLFLGTIIEAAAIIPLDVLVRRKHSCYCGSGTFVALTACAAIGFFLLGPLIILPLVIKRRKRWYDGKCDACGYDMNGCLSSPNCPECGTGWRREP